MTTIRHAVETVTRATARHAVSGKQGSMARRLTGVTCAAALLVLGFSGLASAQQDQTQAPAATTGNGTASTAAQPAQLQEVEVTGSRIKRTTDFNMPTPTTVIDAATMESLGVVNVGQVLALTPANVSTFTPQAAANTPFYAGEYVPDLRGLNGFFNSRTLTLLDGQRAVPTDTSDHFDLNFVPQILVQRIDTVTGGASAAYGSGAVAGVINIILDRTLEGGKLDYDLYDTHYNDGRTSHVAAAFGHGMFDDRFHFVLGGEYQKQDAAPCMASGREWCTANYGPYDSETLPPSLFGAAQTVNGANLRDNFVSANGAIAPAEFSFATFSAIPIPADSNQQATAAGTGLQSYESNGAVNNGTAPGGQGTLANAYSNLLTPLSRGVLTALLTGKITDHITADLDINWGQTQVINPFLPNITESVIGLDNPFLPDGSAAIPGEVGLFGPTGYYIGKDWDASGQIPNAINSTTTLKRIVFGLNGQFGDSSWSWDGHFENGISSNTETEPTDFHATESAMALDAITNPTTGQPECRITAALDANGVGTPAALLANPAGGIAALEAAYTQANGNILEGGTIPSEYPTGVLPGYLSAFNEINSSGLNLIDNVTGLNWLTQEALLGENCVPLNPFGTQPLSAGAIGYATGPLSLALRQTQTDIAVNASGTLFQGIGAGPFTMAVGYEWRQEDVHNNFANCPPSEEPTKTVAYELCLAQTTDFSVQYGNAYAGLMGVNEAYLEFNLPLLKNAPFAKLLEFDIAGRESQYDNSTIYALDVPPGSSDTSTFPTWKFSMLYDPIQGVRFRATESRDSRAPDPRDLYYSQTFVAGSIFGTCYARNFLTSDACNENLLGNIDLRPETATTTTFGIVLTPPQLQGLEFSADWFHIHLINGIEGAAFLNETACGLGTGPAACPGIEFNSYSYTATGSPCNTASTGVSGPLAPVSLPSSVACTAGETLYTGALAYQKADAANLAQVNSNAYNGSFYDTRGIDFSLNYVWALPDGSTLAARALTTFVDEQVYQAYAGGPIISLVGQTGNNTSFIGLGDYQTAPRWRGNVSLTWIKGPWSITPNMQWIGQGTINNQGLSCTEAQLTESSNPCDWVFNAFLLTSANGLTAKQVSTEAYMDKLGYALLPIGQANHVPAYFLFGLNTTYSFPNVLKGLQIFAQVDNLFNKAPPFTSGTSLSGGFNGSGTTSNPVFYNELGLAYRVGFRLNF
jgi:iron complex outermembrane recepter protein